MQASFSVWLLGMTAVFSTVAAAQEHPYLTTQSPVTLLSGNDGELAQLYQLTPDRTTDWNLKVKDSFTVIHLGPDHPPIIKTVYDTVPATCIGTPTMAMSRDGRFGLIANHSRRPEDFLKIVLPAGPQTNADLTPEMLRQEKLTAQYANVLSLIDLSDPSFPVVDRVLFDDFPVHVLPHPDGQRFVVGAYRFFYFFKIVGSRLVEVSRSRHTHGTPCFWIHPQGNRLIATQGIQVPQPIPGEPARLPKPATVHWYSITGNRIEYLSEVKVNAGLPTRLLNTSYGVRISPDGKLALICQRAIPSARDLCDVLVVDLTLDKPEINDVIKQVTDGLESFAFHPNGKMAVATGLGTVHNSIAVMDIASRPVRLMYTLDAKGDAAGIEFTPEGDKLFLASAVAGRIEVFDVLGDYELRKNPKILNIGFGGDSLTIGPRYRPPGNE